MKLFLHIGLNKTGTTAIQAFFARHRERLLQAHGILYPRTGLAGDAHYHLSTALGFSQQLVQAPPERIAPLRDALRREVTAAGAGTLVVSSEFFVLPGEIQAVREFFSGFEIRIVIYLRRHDDWWLSAYNQSVRAVADPPWGAGFASYLAFQQANPKRWYLDYRRFVDAWADVFGARNVLVRPYERRQNQPTLIHDFLTAIGRPEAASLDPAPRKVNRSVSFRALQLIDACQRAAFPEARRARLIEAVLAEFGDGPRFDLPLEVRRRLVAENEAAYAYIARKYLGRADGRLFYDPVLSTVGEDMESTHQLSEAEAMKMLETLATRWNRSGPEVADAPLS